MTDCANSPWAARARDYALQVAQRVIDYGTALARASEGWNPDTPVDAIAGILDQWIAKADRQRAHAEAHIVHAVRPLIADYQPADILFATAERANDAAGHPLLTYETRAVVREEMARHLAADCPKVARRAR